MKRPQQKRVRDAEEPAQSSPPKRRKVTDKLISKPPVATSRKASTPAPTNKRPAAPVGPKRDRKYYFGNGDIILQSENTQFRVHMANLVELGGFFRDLADLPKPSVENQESAGYIDGAPVCPLPDTKPRDIRYLMAFAYGELYPKVATAKIDCLHWNSAIALLHLSRRFDLIPVRSKLIEALTVIFPYGPTYTRVLAVPGLAGVTEADRPLIARTFPLQAINLFREFGLFQLMPMAYYRAAQLSIADIVAGVECSDGTRVSIPPDDVVTVLEGKERLRKSRRAVTLGWLNDHVTNGKHTAPAPQCLKVPIDMTGELCTDYLYQMLLAFNKTGYMDTRSDALAPLSPRMTAETLSQHLCTHCFNALENKMRDCLAENWKQLPSYFGLESWKDVMKTQALEDERYGNLN